MIISRAFNGIALATLTLVGSITATQSAKAEDLVDFLWGGSAEYGGGRSVTSFSPQYKPGQIIVSFSDRRLYLITKVGQATTYPVAVPMGEARWQGVTFISTKKVNPPWTPTPEMVRQNPRLPRWVPGGHPMNPLGIRAMYLGSSMYRIHGTDAPWTIGQPVSHGCIRMTNEDVLDLYPRVNVGTRVTVTWQRFSTSPIASGNDGYGGGSGYGSSNRQSHANEGGLGSLFSYDNDDQAQRALPPPPPASTAAADLPDDQPIEGAPKKKSANVSKKKSTDTASASDKAEKPAKSEKSEKTAKPEKAAATSHTKSHPATDTGNGVPDPVKDGTPAKSTDASPSAGALTKASASAADTVSSDKGGAQVQ